MKRLIAIALVSTAVLAACSPVTTGADGTVRVSKGYRIPAGGEAQIQYRMLDSMNALRKTVNAPPLVLNAQLNAAAATHSRDMSVQNRPWHFGSDGSSPLDRVKRAGYGGRLVGEAISETFETELETLAAWMEEPATKEIILDPQAREMGFDYFQEPNGKIWWTLVTGAPVAAASQRLSAGVGAAVGGFDLSRMDAAIGN